MNKTNVGKIVIKTLAKGFLLSSLAMLAVFTACSSGSSPTSFGSLKVDIQGLSAEVQASLNITGPNDFKQTLQASTVLEKLEPGSYTLRGQDVVQGSDTYFPDKREQTIEVKTGQTANITFAYSKQSAGAGSLEVTIEGLPSGTNADSVVSNSSGFSQQVLISSVLSNLAPGEYQLTAKAVTVGSESFTPAPASQTITISAGKKTDLNVTYAKQGTTAGRLAVAITGLPTDVNAAVSVTGPNGFSEMLTASKTLNVPAGEYTVAASRVDGTYPYHPYPKTQKVNVAAGETAYLVLAYMPTIVKGKEGDRFGSSVAVDGDFMVVGAPYFDFGTSKDGGTAYVYQRSSSGEWLFLKELIPDEGHSPEDYFGWSVDISGDTIVVGAFRAVTEKVCDLKGNCSEVRAGAAYVFERDKGGSDNFGLDQKLIARDGRAGGYFGYSVAIEGDRLLVGAPLHDYDADDDKQVECGSGTDNSECSLGAAYFFFYGVKGIQAQAVPGGTWSDGSMITSSDGATFDFFGSSVALAAETVFIGSPLEDYDADKDGGVACGSTSESECNLGAVYVFGLDKGDGMARLTPSKVSTRDQFGSFITASKDILVVGTGEDAATSSAYLFGRGNSNTDWNEFKTITLENKTTARETNVALHEDKLVIALPYGDADVNGDGKVDCANKGSTDEKGTECAAGAVYMFGRDEGGTNNFGLVKTFVAGDGASYDNFGSDLAIRGNVVVATSPGRASETGAVYVLE
jgi:hypothetical protein